jgi:hypothetical protein
MVMLMVSWNEDITVIYHIMREEKNIFTNGDLLKLKNPPPMAVAMC